MSKVKLSLVSGTVQERELVTAFNFDNVKYVIFDAESTGSMGLPIILVGKEVYGKVVGITEADEWRNTKDCLKKIIAGEQVDYAKVSDELKADDIYYRQLTLPIASFDILKSSYKAPEVENNAVTNQADNIPVFEQIAPEDVSVNASDSVEPVMPTNFSTPTAEESIAPVMEPSPEVVSPIAAEEIPSQNVDTSFNLNNDVDKKDEYSYEDLKREFIAEAEALFDKYFKKFNHED